MNKLQLHPTGSYAFLPGDSAISKAIVATPGHHLIGMHLQTPLPYHAGFTAISVFLGHLGIPVSALCGIELRVPQPLSFEGFAALNQDYTRLLDRYGLLIDGFGPMARTTVAPTADAPAEISLASFTVSVPALNSLGDEFLVSGAGDIRGEPYSAEAIVRPDENTLDAPAEKVAFVLACLTTALEQIGQHWTDVRDITVYTALASGPSILEQMLTPLDPHLTDRVRLLSSRPPLVGMGFEMDVRRISAQYTISLPYSNS